MMASSKKSDVWKHFDLVEANGRKKTNCKLCSHSLAYSSGTSSMKNHLKYKHTSVKTEESNGQTTLKRQTSLIEYHASKRSLTKSKYESLTKDLALMCAVDLRPTAMVEGKGFRRFVKNLNPIYCVPSSNTIVKYVGLIYAELKVDVINELYYRGFP